MSYINNRQPTVMPPKVAPPVLEYQDAEAAIAAMKADAKKMKSGNKGLATKWTSSSQRGTACRRMIAVLGEFNGEFTAMQLAERAGVHPDSAARAARQMAAKGLIEEVDRMGFKQGNAIIWRSA